MPLLADDGVASSLLVLLVLVEMVVDSIALELLLPLSATADVVDIVNGGRCCCCCRNLLPEPRLGGGGPGGGGGGGGGAAAVLVL